MRVLLLVSLVLLTGCALTAPVVPGVTADRQEYIERELAQFAARLEAAPPTTLAAAQEQVRQFAVARPQVFGSALAYAPGMAPGSRARLASPYAWREGRNVRVKDIARSGDYTATDWYRIPAQRGTAGWSEPYNDVLGAGARVRMVTYSIPLYTAESTPRLLAVLTADVQLSGE